MQALLRGSNDAVLLPSPGSGLYSASVALHGGTAVSYPLLGNACVYYCAYMYVGHNYSPGL
jgi:aspartate/methionine/tyrosine aminotransferase